MRIQYMECGLASQIRQYVFVRFAQRTRPQIRWFFDDSDAYVRKAHNGYELERIFGVNICLLSRCFNKKTWEKILEERTEGLLRQKAAGIPVGKSAGTILPQILLEMGVPIVLVEGKRYDWWPAYRFDGEIISTSGFRPEIIDLPYPNIYYYTFPAKKDWFSRFKEENLSELAFPQLRDRVNLQYEEAIQSNYSVGIHVRRGDFLLPPFNRGVSSKLYNTACKQVMEEHPAARFFVFSDDLDWCRANEEELGFNLAGQTTYISGNTGENSYIDMQLLSLCQGIIRNAESSFSQVAGWLDRNLQFEIKLNPEKEL